MCKLSIMRTVVFVLTFLIVFGLLFVFGAIYKKSRNMKNMPETISLNEAIGSSIHSMKEINGHLYIMVKDGGTSDRIIIFDPAENKKISQITLN